VDAAERRRIFYEKIGEGAQLRDDVRALAARMAKIEGDVARLLGWNMQKRAELSLWNTSNSTRKKLCRWPQLQKIRRRRSW
jgi:hypothetical protein